MAWLFLLPFAVVGQDRYTAEYNYLQASDGKELGTLRFKHFFPDTSLDNAHQFFPISTNGLFGLPSAPLRFNTQVQTAGFSFFTPPYTGGFTPTYYTSKGPFADLTGYFGGKNYQLLQLFYTQTLFSRLNLSLRMDRMNNEGYYNRQSAFLQRLMSTINYANQKNSSGFTFYYYGNATRHAENGGLRDTLMTDSMAVLLKSLLKTKLSAANRDNRENTLQFQPWWCLGGNDSSGAHYLKLSSKLFTGTYKYTDSQLKTDQYYQHFYRDSSSTKDSSRVRVFRNELGYSYVTKGFQVGGGGLFESATTWQNGDSSFTNSGLYAQAGWQQKDTLGGGKFGSLRFEYITQGNNAGNYHFSGEHTLVMNQKKQRWLKVTAGAGLRNADYQYYKWNSNHFLYQQRLSPVNELKTELFYHYSKAIKITAQYLSTSNFVYFNAQALPEQYKGTVTSTAIRLQLAHTWFNHLRTTVDYTRQLTSQRLFQRVPPSITKAGVYYYGQHYNKVLEVQTGLELTVIESFQALAYMPATQAFYLQNNFTGSYPYVDYVLNVHIRPVTVTIAIRNTLQGLTGSDYGITPGYYQPDRTLWLGLRWMFYDWRKNRKFKDELPFHTI